MPSTKLRSDIGALIDLLPTVKEAQLAKQGLRALRDAALYKQGKAVSLNDQQALQDLGVTEILLRWIKLCLAVVCPFLHRLTFAIVWL